METYSFRSGLRKETFYILRTIVFEITDGL